jgi:hypothetical protein
MTNAQWRAGTADTGVCLAKEGIIGHSTFVID